jgi:hypothetical protein
MQPVARSLVLERFKPRRFLGGIQPIKQEGITLAESWLLAEEFNMWLLKGNFQRERCKLFIATQNLISEIVLQCA